MVIRGGSINAGQLGKVVPAGSSNVEAVVVLAGDDGQARE
jgi:hypothetical protein